MSSSIPTKPTLQPYHTRLSQFEFFSTDQAYYLVGCDTSGIEKKWRIIKMDRTLIEHHHRASNNSSAGAAANAAGKATSPVSYYTTTSSAMSTEEEDSAMTDCVGSDSESPSFRSSSANNTKQLMLEGASSASSVNTNNAHSHAVNSNSNSSNNNNNNNNNNNGTSQNTQDMNPTLRPLGDFLFEDPTVYTSDEIREVLDMINDGNLRDDNANHGNRYNNNSDDPFTENHGGGATNNSSMNSNNGMSSMPSSSSSSINHQYSNSQKRQNTNTNSSNSGGNNGGGLEPICKAYGILGFIRFLDCYYLTLITKRAKVGCIGGNSIYTVKNTETFPLKPAERRHSSQTSPENNSTDPSSMLLNMWNRGKRSVGLGLTNREIAELRYQGLYAVVDLTKNFFFSYSYDLTRSLQENFLAMTSKPFPPPPFKDMYAWNFFLTRELENCANSMTSFHWVLPVVHGAFIQRKLHDYGRSLNLVLLARRSRHFAGTRYLKRGVSDRGKVANDVEHEQIIHDETTSSEGVFSSFLQIRGSIPTFWTQESSVTMPKPPIVLNRVDPTYQATQAHFEDLLKRYGPPIIVVDLVKQSEKREREVIVGNEFRNAIDYINCHIDDAYKILYCALDYSHISKHRNLNVSSSLNDIATWSVNETGFFCSSPQWKIVEGGSIEPFDEECCRGAKYLTERLGVPFFPMEQLGILRTNCIDCLDRTNVAQFSAGVEALGQQLVVMGIRSSPKLDPSSIIVRMLIDMYVEIGDQIALQYGGSEAHKKVASGATSTIPGPMGKHKELLTSIRRYYSNAFTDRLKQDAMNLFLGYYVPCRNTTPLWELDNDSYLHNFHVNAGRGSLQSMKTYQNMFGVNWDDSEHHQYRRNDSTKSYNNIGDANRVNLVKKRCKAQNEALSLWWKAAILNHIQNRMWIKLGNSPAEDDLPPRFDRIYHPTELSDFDKFFARPWVTPSRLSHDEANQHQTLDAEIDGIGMKPRKASAKETKVSLFDERVQSYKIQGSKTESHQESETGQSLHDFIKLNGFNSKSRTTLNQLLKAYNQQPRGNTPSEHSNKQSLWKPLDQHKYIGSLQEKQEPPLKYLDYASKHTMPRRGFRPGAREEFTQLLSDTSLDSNDVQGIRKLAESAHICTELDKGPYRGLNHNESAVRVATVIHDHYNYLEEKIEEGELSYDEPPPGLLAKLKRTNLYSVGVTETFCDGWSRLANAEKTYTEILDMSSVGYKRSDVTTESSMKLYSSFFDPSTTMSKLEQNYATGGHKLIIDPSKPLRRSTRPCEEVSGPGKDLKKFDEARFILKAASRGINIKKTTVQTDEDKIDVLKFQGSIKVPSGFEQINEDLFARKDNKFMVFNGASVNSWKTPPEPVTKTKMLDPWSFKQKI